MKLYKLYKVVSSLLFNRRLYEIYSPLLRVRRRPKTTILASPFRYSRGGVRCRLYPAGRYLYLTAARMHLAGKYLTIAIIVAIDRRFIEILTKIKILRNLKPTALTPPL